MQEQKRRIEAQNDQQRKDLRAITIELNTLKAELNDQPRDTSSSTSRRYRGGNSRDYQPRDASSDSRNSEPAEYGSSVVLYNKRPALPKRDTQPVQTVGLWDRCHLQAVARYSYEGSRDFNSSPMHKGTRMTLIKYNDAKDWALVSFDGMTTWEPVSYLDVEESSSVSRPRSQHIPSLDGATTKRRGRVIANFDGIDKSEMTVQKGEIVQVLKEEGEWLLGTVGTRVGVHDGCNT